MKKVVLTHAQLVLWRVEILARIVKLVAHSVLVPPPIAKIVM